MTLGPPWRRCWADELMKPLHPYAPFYKYIRMAPYWLPMAPSVFRWRIAPLQSWFVYMQATRAAAMTAIYNNINNKHCLHRYIYIYIYIYPTGSLLAPYGLSVLLKRRSVAVLICIHGKPRHPKYKPRHQNTSPAAKKQVQTPKIQVQTPQIHSLGCM